jgi:hypothetical protein
MRGAAQAWKPSREQLSFVRMFGERVLNGEAGLFIGAGVSRQAGFIDWKELLRETAHELDLDIDKEHDLLALAQYQVNARCGRGDFNQHLMDAFLRDAQPTVVHEILTRLPIDTVWTTNYDQILEDAYKSAGRHIEIKLTIENLAQARKGRDVTIYKMHGCVTQSHLAVLTKQDYEDYDVTRRLFTDSLKGDFIEKTLLFLGFSFTDPNVERILAKVRGQLGVNQRTHYWITRRSPTTCVNGVRTDEELAYEQRKAELQSQDLLRYGIQTVWVDEYEQIPDLLRLLESFVTRRGVFVSGAAHDPSPLGVDRLNDLSKRLGSEIIRRGFNLVSGFGVGIAEQTILGAYHAVYECQQVQPADRVLIRPFPGNTPVAMRNVAFKRHREDMISRVGAVVVISGNKDDGCGSHAASAGVEEEVSIALSMGKPVIPVGISGHVANSYWQQAMAKPAIFLPGLNGIKELTVLGDPLATNEQITNAVLELLQHAQKAASARLTSG